ncbi:MAG: anaerobic glycerol-3-phosphate dehydrogenase subunit C [Phycisphaerae bacterium]|nr:anaerobic glycerol-3-phosphate dehydrogenase subunit C [Phycisphaerae bacterium]NIP54408.1 anaerobic glycerol-3-phosphate dehydrogenase subunit C [Phycisphaerae bacterium]NIS53267.1 anaerobic glycerol-3-phosphate dehydrogenase subunit C [Phycisphaerae bacterium]NIU10793.1 anaerobic glycerol-3-phosphate dehydrogenase subunit C [Phycisphaerae bacterium]NIU58588.1 anaerobic glycerol-3-phosphate dehydrogenase subunit C [Phycisphaerae bacterium]
MHEKGEQVAADLAEVIQGDVYADILNRAAYSTDASIYRIVPNCIVAPRDTNDIVAVVKYAAAMGIPVVARGAGSGLAGEALCSGIVFDMTRYMNRIISVDDDGKRVVCEPGVVLDDLNDCLAGYGRKIGPDPSSSNRATVGGGVANNSTGAHYLQYGYICDHVESIEAVLADGSVVEFENDFDPEQTADDKAASVAQSCKTVLSGKEAIIKKALPKAGRNRSGYNVDGICHNGRIDLARLLTGSEGTLAIFTKIVLKTVAVPAAKALLQLEFDSLDKMAKATTIIVNSGASACELMGKTVIEMAYEALPEYRDVLPAGAAALLLVEHTGQNRDEVKGKIERTDTAVGTIASGRTIVFDTKQQGHIWKSRKDAGPLLYRARGRQHPAEFMEDVSVGHEGLGKYITGLQDIGKRYDIEMSFFGHAGDGLLHIRPFMDLSEPAEVEKMRSVANEVFELAWSLDGTISGEHAEGLVRAAFIRRQCGDEFYELLCKIKDIFDPDGLMNPGKIINDDSDVMIRNLRAGHKILPERLETDLLFEKDELYLALDQCNGCGVCRSRESDLRMCPVFRALGEEMGSSRAKANILNFWATGQLKEEDFESPEFRKFLDLCVNCKACLVQCPSGVDVSRLVSTARAEYIKRRGLRRAEHVLSHNRYFSMLGSIFSPLSNLFMRLPAFKWLLENTAGIDKRRGMPCFKRRSFLKAGRKYLVACETIENPVDKVAYFMDTYANNNDHELGFAVLDVLRANDIEVILPQQRPAPLPAIVYGDVKRARKDLSFNVRHLAKAVRDGYKVVCSEPSAALCLKTELRHFVSGPYINLISDNTYELMNYLLGLLTQGKLKAPTKSVMDEYIYHLPCHLCAVGNGTASIKLLQELCGVSVVDLKAGCCGLAGTFGMQKKNYELSSQIAAGLKEALDKTPTKYVLTECAACKMQIEHISDCIVRHPIKVIAEAYSNYTRE